MGNSNPAYKFQSIQASEKTVSIADKKIKIKSIYSWLYICFQPGFSMSVMDALEKKVKSERVQVRYSRY